MSAVLTDIGAVVADVAVNYVGVPSTHHSTFHTGIYMGNEKVIHSPGVGSSQVKIVSLEEFTSGIELPAFCGGLVAAKRLLI